MFIFRDSVTVTNPNNSEEKIQIPASARYSLYGKKENLLIGSIDLVMEDIWVNEVFLRAPIKAYNTRTEIGIIYDYNWPLRQLMFLFNASPIVKISPSQVTPNSQLGSVVDISRNHSSNIAAGNTVIIAEDPTIEGKLIQPEFTISSSNLITKAIFKHKPLHFIDVYIVNFGSQIIEKKLYGSRILRKSDESLLGMLVEVTGSSSNLQGYVYPAQYI